MRRVTFDLTGLPPTQAETDAFLTDPSARETVVDRLQASPRFGERMATPWLDVARYADSFGYQADIQTEAWPFRDWVIRAFNDNLPLDQFITQQLADDLLPDATRDQKLATTFNRIHRKTNEGGSVDEEFRQEGISDRIHTTGTASSKVAQAVAEFCPSPHFFCPPKSRKKTSPASNPKSPPPRPRFRSSSHPPSPNSKHGSHRKSNSPHPISPRVSSSMKAPAMS